MDHFTLDKQGNFMVQESVLLNVISAVCLLATFIGVLITLDFNIRWGGASMLLLYLMLIIFSTVFFVKAIRSQVILTINKAGISYKGHFITGWDQFITAYITQNDLMVSESSTGLYDKFRIVVEFVAPGKAIRYRCEMRMPGS